MDHKDKAISIAVSTGVMQVVGKYNLKLNILYPKILPLFYQLDHEPKCSYLQFLFYNLGFPAPLFYGFTIDRTCMVRDTRCGGEGRCLDYNNSKFRTRLHGFTMMVKGAATIAYIVGWYFSRKYQYEEQKDEAPDSPLESPESKNKLMLKKKNENQA